MRFFNTLVSVVSLLCLSGAASADSVQGSYVEARSVADRAPDDTQPECSPGQAVLAWQIRQGVYEGEKLDGQVVIAMVSAEPSPGGAPGQTKTVFYVDSRTTKAQERALVQLAKDLAPAAIHDTGSVVRATLDVRIAEGCGCGAAVVECPLAKFRTRRMTDAEATAQSGGKCPSPLGEVFSSTPAVATEYAFEGETAPVHKVVTAFVGSFSR